MINKRKEIQKYLLTVKEATVKEIYDNVPFGYYCNEHKHLGELLSKMVKAKQVHRNRKGVYSLSPLAVREHQEITKQQDLFNQ